MSAVGKNNEDMEIDSISHDLQALNKEAENTSLKLESITDGVNERKIPQVKFVEDIGKFASSFEPPASSELMIGAFSDLFAKYKAYETSLLRKRNTYQEKIPEIEKSLGLVHFLKKKQQDDETLVTRYNLADMLYAKAQVDVSSGIVNLWLGANVMLEYTYDEAIELLSSKEKKAKLELDETTQDLAFVRNQIITSEVNISRIYNWDVRQKRLAKANAAK
jgi:prefoldin subunit 5